MLTTVLRFLGFCTGVYSSWTHILLWIPLDFNDHISGYSRAYINAFQWKIETCFAQLDVYITLLHCNSTVTCFAFQSASLSRNCMLNVKCICTHCINVYVPIPACVCCYLREFYKPILYSCVVCQWEPNLLVRWCMNFFILFI